MAPLTEINIDALLTSLQTHGRALIDVRSEDEFAEGHIPGAINIPILNNEERHLVGLTYKQQGQERALEKGHELVAPHRAERIAMWSQIARHSPLPPIIMCWRGGLRSRIACDWLQEAGVQAVRLRGGYKAFRKFLLGTFENPPRKIIVLTGLTGNGKTELLRHLPIPSVDLEKMAHHRGSAYGWHLKGKQPTQSNFENQLGLELLKLHHLPIVLEDESSYIGSVGLPKPLKEAMRHAPVVILEETIDVRIRWVADDYVFRPLRDGHNLHEVLEHLVKSLDRIQKKIGGLAHQQVKEMIHSAFELNPLQLASHEPWIRMLLEDYYDKKYQHAFNRQNRKILFRGNRKAVIKWFQDHASHFLVPPFGGDESQKLNGEKSL